MRLSITRERYVALGDTLWHAPTEAATPEHTFSFGVDRICKDIEALAIESEQRMPPPPRPVKANRKEGRSTRVDPVLDAQFRRLLGLV